MTDEEVAVKLEGHDHEIKSAKHRLVNLEEQTKLIQNLVLAVDKLANNMGNMINEQKEQGARLCELEKAPGENWKVLLRTVLTLVVGYLFSFIK